MTHLPIKLTGMKKETMYFEAYVIVGGLLLILSKIKTNKFYQLNRSLYFTSFRVNKRLNLWELLNSLRVEMFRIDQNSLTKQLEDAETVLLFGSHAGQHS